MPIAGASPPSDSCSLGCPLRDVVYWREHREALVVFEMMENAASTAMEGGGEQRHDASGSLKNPVKRFDHFL